MASHIQRVFYTTGVGTPPAQGQFVTPSERSHVSKVVSKSIAPAPRWWERGREDSVIEMASIVLQDQLEWLPEPVLRQLIAPAKNDDVDILLDIELH